MEAKPESRAVKDFREYANEKVSHLCVLLNRVLTWIVLCLEYSCCCCCH